MYLAVMKMRTIKYLDPLFPTFLIEDGDSQNIKDNNNHTNIKDSDELKTTIIYLDSPSILPKLPFLCRAAVGPVAAFLCFYATVHQGP